jgi:hypothetical protein
VGRGACDRVLQPKHDDSLASVHVQTVSSIFVPSLVQLSITERLRWPGNAMTAFHCRNKSSTHACKVSAYSLLPIEGERKRVFLLKVPDLFIGPPLWSSGQSSWLQIQRSRVRFPEYQIL